ncbi:MAG: APC family permease [Pseudonocardiaceae bacterium]
MTLPKRLLIGRPLASRALGDTLLPKKLALPIFCSDALSSVAYATEAILVALSVGGLAFYHLAPYLAVAVAVLFVIVAASYRQTCHAYPGGDGSYIVSHQNLGSSAGLAAAALLVDYVMTVAVSVVAGVSAITSALPAAAPHAVGISIGFVTVLMVVNLRGVRETGKTFAIPTYGFVVGIFVMFAWAGVKLGRGQNLVAESAGYPVQATEHATGVLAVFLILRAFAQGCTALTGVEAISNGVPVFQKPKAGNAATVLGYLAALAVAMGIGITLLAVLTGVHAALDPTQLGLPPDATPKTVLAQIAAAVFGPGSIGFYAIQVFTAAILILATNTSFNGFPGLASILARDRYFPRQFHNRGDRLVYSNGIVVLGVFAAALISVFNANTNALIQLYVIGVFIAFTLSQIGMVKHWHTELRTGAPANQRGRIRRSQLINGLGAAATGVVFVIVLVTKFLEGAYLIVIAIPLLYALMRSINRHYASVAHEIAVADVRPVAPSRNHVLVLVSKVSGPALRALAYARFLRPHTLEAITVTVDDDEPTQLRHDWDTADLDIPLKIIESPYREITRPILKYVRDYPRTEPRDIITVVIPEYVVGHWWEQLLHNQSALRLKARLLYLPDVVVIDIPWYLRSTGVHPNERQTQQHDDYQHQAAAHQPAPPHDGPPPTPPPT